MAYPQTGSTSPNTGFVPTTYTTDPTTGRITSTTPGTQGSYATHASLSTQILIQVEAVKGTFIPVGAIQSLTPTETRPLQRVPECGTDGYVEIVPWGNTDIQLTVQRLVFDQLRLPPAFARGFEHIHAQRLPFNIQIMDKNRQNNDDENNKTFLLTVYENCWLGTYETNYMHDNYLVTESATIFAERAFNVIKDLSKDAYTGVKGARQVAPQRDYIQEYGTSSIERQVDSGRNIGSLRPQNLLDKE
jgi:hypothetical protein